MKRTLSILLAVVFLLTALPLGAISVFAATSGTTGDCTWTLDGTHLTISGNGAMGDYSYVSRPWGTTIKSVTIEDSVTSIGNYAFYYCTSLTSVTIPDGVTSIGDYAFSYCDSLTSITIPDSVTSIGNYAFYACDSLTSIFVSENNPNYSSLNGVLFNKDKTILIACPGGKSGAYTIPDSVTAIGEDAFLGCVSLTSVVIPDSVITIGNRAFLACTSLTSMTIPDSVATIGEEAFSDCYRLSSINLSNSVITIGNSAFAWTGLVSITIPNNVTTIGAGAFLGCSDLTSVTISDGVTTIGNSAFSQCYALASVTIPNSITTIGAGAFHLCTSLTTVSIGNGVTSIGDGAFGYCDSLTSIFVSENNPAYSSLDGVLFNKDKTSLIQYPAGCTLACYCIPDSVTAIGSGAFEMCSFLTAVTIPDSVTAIGDSAFSKCYSLTSVIIPESVTYIGLDVFGWCNSLTSVTIPHSIIGIGNYAFEGCDILSDVYYVGTENDRTNVSVGSNNTPLANATWHYFSGAYDATCNECGKEREVSVPTKFGGNSISEDTSGLAFRFDMRVEGMTVNGTTAIYGNATVGGYKLLSMGAVVTNGYSELDIPAVYLCDLEPDSAGFAVRVKNIPTNKCDVDITATPYIVLEIDGVATTIYGEAQTCSYNDVKN